MIGVTSQTIVLLVLLHVLSVMVGCLTGLVWFFYTEGK